MFNMKDWKDIIYEECKNEPLPSIFIAKKDNKVFNKWVDKVVDN